MEARDQRSGMMTRDEWLAWLEEAWAKSQGVAASRGEEWVGLTDEEIDTAWRSVDYTVPYSQFRIDVARAIEAKLQEKNHG